MSIGHKGGPGATVRYEGDPLTSDPFVPQTHDPESIDGLRVSLHWWLLGTGRLWRNLVDERLKTADQTQPRWRVLSWASLLPGIKQTELAERMNISGPTLVRILDSLEAQGLIERRESAGDRRVKEIHLTDRGYPVVEQINIEVSVIRNAVLDGVSEKDLRTCLALLAHIRHNLAALGPQPGSSPIAQILAD
jgi:MarR family transcriptional regulator for hemolysin